MKIGETISARLGGCYERWRPVLGVLERELLVFPLAVVLLVTATFWFGGTCSLWHTWGGVAIAFLVAAFDRRVSWRERFRGMALFLFYLALVWVLSGCLAESGLDNRVYRHPTIRLLMEGWNPIYVSTPEALQASGLVDISELRVWHTLFISRALEIFCGAFGLFLRAPFNVALPILFFIAPVTLAALWRFTREEEMSRLARFAMLSVLAGVTLWSIAWLEFACDLLISLVGIGVITSMVRILRGRQAWGTLLVCSLWMITAKQSALPACFGLWGVFSCVALWRGRTKWRRWVVRLTLCAGLLGGGALWICTSPYLTSWLQYGHPLYPAYTVDENRFPAYDITGDFKNRNADAEAMGRLGYFCNAYLSPTLTRAYYAWKLDNPDFMPYCEVWANWNEAYGESSFPTSPPTRIGLLISTFLLLLLGNNRLRFVGGLCIFSLILLPTQYIGYVRYTPWIALIFALAAGLTVDWASKYFKRWRVGIVLGGGCVLYGVAIVLMLTTVQIDCQLEIEQAIRSPGLQAIVLEKHILGDTLAYANTKLLCKQEPRLRELKLLSPNWEGKGLRHFTLTGFSAVLKDGAEAAPSLYREASGQPTRVGRYLRYALFVPRTYLVSLPKLMWWRVESLWR